ncbi:prepilin-type N-terminal cleavage/methylation domain-containing protein [Shewanella maritima]|uniref:Prepilin-type N-terminal cleavage/methylation domain-containing protein n=2 Tax=Shewanella maritima TaxID=2520507 RepID=A0A411PK66_9GAMM|nr:prepilin-type N-terminal cleavage/methylation domain-containing protein [Shewanella maritima]
MTMTKLIHQRGMSLVELMVAMVISLFLSAGLFTMFNMSSSNVTTTSQFNQLQENGRIALTLMERDINQLGFFGDLTGTEMILNTNTTNSATAVTSDCVGGGVNNETFPENVPAHFRRLWGFEYKTTVEINCNSALTPDKGTDIIQVKRLMGPSLAAADLESNRYYASVTSNEIEFFNGSATPPTKLNSRLWEYQHHVYFVETDNNIPVLKRRSLNISNGMSNEEQLVEGIENLRFMYGFDNDGDSTPDVFLPAEDVSTFMWDNQGFQRLVAVKIFVLVRSVQPDRTYSNDVTYTLGDKEISGASSANSSDPNYEHYRRRVMSTTVVLENPVLIRT